MGTDSPVVRVPRQTTNYPVLLGQPKHTLKHNLNQQPQPHPINLHLKQPTIWSALKHRTTHSINHTQALNQSHLQTHPRSEQCQTKDPQQRDKI